MGINTCVKPDENKCMHTDLLFLSCSYTVSTILHHAEIILDGFWHGILGNPTYHITINSSLAIDDNLRVIIRNPHDF